MAHRGIAGTGSKPDGVCGDRAAIWDFSLALSGKEISACSHAQRILILSEAVHGHSESRGKAKGFDTVVTSCLHRPR